MRFDKFSKDEINGIMPLLEDGLYKYKVIKTFSKPSKDGNSEHITLMLKVQYNGLDYIVYDTLVPAFRVKIKNFCRQHNMLKQLEEGNIELSDCDNLEGEAQISKRIDATGHYPTKNIVIDYPKHGDNLLHNTSNTNVDKTSVDKAIDQAFNDDINF